MYADRCRDYHGVTCLVKRTACCVLRTVEHRMSVVWISSWNSGLWSVKKHEFATIDLSNHDQKDYPGTRDGTIVDMKEII